MKTLLVMLVACVTAYVVTQQRQSPPTQPVVGRPQATEKPSPPPSAAELIAAERAKLMPLHPGTQTKRYWGHIVQHLQDGKLLVKVGDRDARGYDRVLFVAALFTDRDYSELPDGAEINFHAIPNGTYQYTTVSGAMSTIPQLLYVPPELLPSATPARSSPGKSAAWMWDPDRRTPLDRAPYDRK
jgi:hypothetical protein